MIRLLSFLSLLTWAVPAWADYVVERGDVLSVIITEEPKLSRETKVNADGRIMLPQLGGIPVAGAGLDAIRERIEQELAKRDIIRSPTVMVEVATYRPFFIGGAVARPGAIAFEPGLTVRHALVLAGGPDRSRDAAQLTTTEMLELRAKWRASSYHLLQVKSRIARLEAELNRAGNPNLGALDTRFVSPQDAKGILSLDAGLLRDRLEEWSAEQAHLKDVLSLLDFELQVLSKQADHQERERALQQDEVENARSLLNKGLIPLPRLQELERQESRLSRDLLENQAFAARASQNKANMKHDLDSADTKWRIEVRRDLSDAMLERTRLEAEIEVLGDRLMASGLSLNGDGTIPRLVPEVIIHRSVAGRDEVLNATMTTEVQPGDVLDVDLAEAPS